MDAPRRPCVSTSAIALSRIVALPPAAQQDLSARFQIVFKVKLLRQGEREVARGDFDIVGGIESSSEIGARWLKNKFIVVGPAPTSVRADGRRVC